MGEVTDIHLMGEKETDFSNYTHTIYIPDLNHPVNKWDKRFLELAKHISSWSKDPSTKCGCVITDFHHKIISVGYNGFPKNVDDDPVRYNDRDTKYAITVHAEANAVVTAAKKLQNASIFIWPFMPCSSCAGLIIQSGIERVVSFQNDNPRWAKSFEISTMMFDEANIILNLYPSISNLE